jgi:hypothetical protein
MPESSLAASEGGSSESSLIASPRKSPPWRALDFERGTVHGHFDAKEAIPSAPKFLMFFLFGISLYYLGLVAGRR